MRIQRIIGVLIACILLVTQFYILPATAQPEMSAERLVRTTVTVNGAEVTTINVGDIFAVNFHLENIATLSSIYLPFAYDPEMVTLLDATTNHNPVIAGSPVRDNVRVNGGLVLHTADDTLLGGGGHWPRFDVEIGFVSLLIRLQNMANPPINTSILPNGIVATLYFRAVETGNFTPFFSTTHDEWLPRGVRVRERITDAGGMIQIPAVYPATAIAPLQIVRDRTSPPTEVIVHENSNGTATVIVRSDVSQGGPAPGAFIRLYDNAGAMGNPIAGGAGDYILNNYGYVIFYNVSLNLVTNDRFYAAATEPNRTESTTTLGYPGEFETELVIVIAQPSTLIFVPLGTAASAITNWHPALDGVLGIRVIGRPTIPPGYGLFVGDGIVNPVTLTVVTQNWEPIGTFDPNVPGLYEFVFRGTLSHPDTPNALYSELLLPVYQDVFILPDGMSVDERIVVFTNAGSTFWEIVRVGEMVDEPQIGVDFPARPGYTFGGWVDETTNALFDFDTPILEHTFLRAIWISDNVFTITGNLAGGTVANQPVSYTITIDGVQYRAGTVNTDANGNYIITEIPYGARVVITPPAQSDWIVSPANRTLGSVTYNQVNQNFIYIRNQTGGGGGWGGGGGGTVTAPMTTITIRGIDEDGNEIYRQVITQVQIGSTQTATAPNLEGFVLDDDRTKTITTVSDGSQNVITFRYVRSMLEHEHHYRYIFGFPDGTIRPEAQITREEVATIFFRLLTTEARNTNRAFINTFPDVYADRWSNQQISTMQRAGIVQGRLYGSFEPTAPITCA